MEIEWGHVLVAVITAIPVAWGIHAAGKRTKVVDAQAMKSGVTDDERAGVAQLQQAQKDLMATYRADIADLRKELRDETLHQDKRVASLEKDRDEYRKQLAEMERRIARNGG